MLFTSASTNEDGLDRHESVTDWTHRAIWSITHSAMRAPPARRAPIHVKNVPSRLRLINTYFFLNNKGVCLKATT